jgi:hypothetical protein
VEVDGRGPELSWDVVARGALVVMFDFNMVGAISGNASLKMTIAFARSVNLTPPSDGF